MEYGRLEKDPLFLALTRPPLVLGVTYMWVALEGLLGAVYFINTSDFMMFIYVAGLHLIGWLITSRDPQFLDVMMVSAKISGKCKNKMYHGNTTSYDIF